MDCRYAANVGPQISEFYESYFGIDYPIAKQDQFGIPPLDYAAGAMENWGLITYRYTYCFSCECEIHFKISISFFKLTSRNPFDANDDHRSYCHGGPEMGGDILFTHCCHNAER